MLTVREVRPNKVHGVVVSIVAFAVASSLGCGSCGPMTMFEELVLKFVLAD